MPKLTVEFQRAAIYGRLVMSTCVSSIFVQHGLFRMKRLSGTNKLTCFSHVWWTALGPERSCNTCRLWILWPQISLGFMDREHDFHLGDLWLEHSHGVYQLTKRDTTTEDIVLVAKLKHGFTQPDLDATCIEAAYGFCVIFMYPAHFIGDRVAKCRKRWRPYQLLHNLLVIGSNIERFTSTPNGSSPT